MPPFLKLSYQTPTDPSDIRVRVTGGNSDIGTVFFRSSALPMTANGDALFCLGLTLAMELGAPVRINGEVEQGLLQNAGPIKDLLRSWYPFYRDIPVSTDGPTQRHYPEGRGTALFYSGGIDSSYSLAEAAPRLTALISLIDAKRPGEMAHGSERLIASTTRIAETYGLTPVFIETNVRYVIHPYLGWTLYHGSAMAAIRHLLGRHFDNVLIASSGDETVWDCPWGSHPTLDPLHATAGARLEHHGLVSRLEKTRTLLEHPALMRELHICTDSATHNCGLCKKCRFTMACLTALDAFDQAPTFPKDLQDAPNIFNLGDEASQSDLRVLRRALAETGRHPGVLADVEKAISDYQRAKARRTRWHLPNFKRRFYLIKRRARYWRATHLPRKQMTG
ncbi:hypothetical protein [Pseudohoeflea coraliihabitans]|uniref:7-cyano-7-deazaguanine synthase n=1 Tax=Pseudohoeflea coraliihabitans TaxID=2860393 RepID=A0ABS6WIC9_9HYPH|nr:hypothetical protein [Pseudohoeflea sp. DP4N28-3]MBW3095704.1 hypothetical protein [Pseudohoeflea sp. DP4N28-3]